MEPGCVFAWSQCSIYWAQALLQPDILLQVWHSVNFCSWITGSRGSDEKMFLPSNSTSCLLGMGGVAHLLAQTQSPRALFKGEQLIHWLKPNPTQKTTQKAERDRAGVAELVSQSKLQPTHTLCHFTHLVRLLEAVSQTHSKHVIVWLCAIQKYII